MRKENFAGGKNTFFESRSVACSFMRTPEIKLCSNKIIAEN